MALPDKERLREIAKCRNERIWRLKVKYAEIKALAQYVEKAQALSDKWRVITTTRDKPDLDAEVHEEWIEMARCCADELDELSNRNE